MRKLMGIIAVLAAVGLLAIPASGAAAQSAIPAGAVEGTVNVGAQPNSNPFEGGCKEYYVCIWTGSNYSGQLSYWYYENYGCKTHEAFHTFYSFFNAGGRWVIFGTAGEYSGHSGNPTPGATTGNVCIRENP
jgi:hypothetical protein